MKNSHIINVLYPQLTVKPSPLMVDLLTEEVVDYCQLRKAGNTRSASLLSFESLPVL